MTFEEFLKNCSVDIIEKGTNTQILVIFSAGFRKEYSSEFVKDYEDLAKELVAGDLYGYLNKEFGSNGNG